MAVAAGKVTERLSGHQMNHKKQSRKLLGKVAKKAKPEKTGVSGPEGLGNVPSEDCFCTAKGTQREEKGGRPC